MTFGIQKDDFRQPKYDFRYPKNITSRIKKGDMNFVNLKYDFVNLNIRICKIKYNTVGAA